MIEAYALLQELEASGLIQIDIASPDLNGPFDDDCKKLIHFLSGVRRDYVPRRTERLLEVQRNRFRVSLGSGFFYEFTQGDLDRIQVLINELRTLISESEVFEADHQRRLLVRLEKLQAEMHKKVSDVDRFWGLFGEAGIALGYVRVIEGTKGGRARDVHPGDLNRARSAIERAQATLRASGQRYLVTRADGTAATGLKQALGIYRNLCHRAGIQSHAAAMRSRRSESRHIEMTVSANAKRVPPHHWISATAMGVGASSRASMHATLEGTSRSRAPTA
jgi:hypothetical protein